MLQILEPPYDPSTVSATVFIISHLALLPESRKLLGKHPSVVQQLTNLLKTSSTHTTEVESLGTETFRFSAVALAGLASFLTSSFTPQSIEVLRDHLIFPDEETVRAAAKAIATLGPSTPPLSLS